MIEQILSRRGISKEPFWDIVYEWEDVLAQSCSLKVVGDANITNPILNKIAHLCEPIVDCISTKKCSLVFEMTTSRPWGHNKTNIIPAIIDCFAREDGELKRFERAFSKNPLVLISSKEVYDFLVKRDVQLKLNHWALSLPDKYAFSPSIVEKKEFDFILAGRVNHVFEDYLRRYFALRPEVTYLKREWVPGGIAYVDGRGCMIGPANTREEYIGLLRKCRIALYATPGMDGGEVRTNGFNQVTPRFLEFIASGCHVLARYPDNSDTFYYELDEMTSRIMTYEDFVRAADRLLGSQVDSEKYVKYLRRHYTSHRAKELMSILGGIP